MVKRIKLEKRDDKETSPMEKSGVEKSGKPTLRGRPKGIPNKHGALVKQALLLAGEALGDLEPLRHQNGKLRRNKDGLPLLVNKKGHDGLMGYLCWLGRNHPTSFASLLAKTIPQAVTGADDGPVRLIYANAEELAEGLKKKGVPPAVIEELNKQVFGHASEDSFVVEGTMTPQ